jgi:hypothetical protein
MMATAEFAETKGNLIFSMQHNLEKQIQSFGHQELKSKD